jgi:hypothetical protein
MPTLPSIATRSALACNRDLLFEDDSPYKVRRPAAPYPTQNPVTVLDNKTKKALEAQTDRKRIEEERRRREAYLAEARRHHDPQGVGRGEWEQEERQNIDSGQWRMDPATAAIPFIAPLLRQA